MVITTNAEHARLFALHASAGDALIFHKAIKRQMAKLGLSASDFEPFSASQTDPYSPDLNVRAHVEWAESVEPPSDPLPAKALAAHTMRHKSENEMKAENVNLLGRLAATLARRFGD